jgi:hypothetical protein
LVNRTCYSIVDLVRETGSTTTLSPPLLRVHTDSELALARVLGLGSGRGTGAHALRDGMLFGLMLSVALALAMMTVSAVL